MMKKLLLASALIATSFTAQAANFESGQAVYDAHCKGCHEKGLVQAPVSHDSEKWAAINEQGMETLLTTVKSGKGAMPPKATCVTCDDEDYTAAIEYMSAPAE
ncbi:c-type cytochrome [Neptuniibacter sp. QD37_11]|uniref:c-type cytochrome n=1 Tax=Neptuniibacter sp. QD37_11 TaxID=3398209 RepID=UPI0039F4771E